MVLSADIIDTCPCTETISPHILLPPDKLYSSFFPPFRVNTLLSHHKSLHRPFTSTTHCKMHLCFFWSHSCPTFWVSLTGMSSTSSLVSGLFFKALSSCAAECLPSFRIFSASVVMATTPASHPGFHFPIGNFSLAFKMRRIFENPFNIQPSLMTNIYLDIYENVSDFQPCQTVVSVIFDFQSFWMMDLQWNLSVSCRPPNTLIHSLEL